MNHHPIPIHRPKRSGEPQVPLFQEPPLLPCPFSADDVYQNVTHGGNLVGHQHDLSGLSGAFGSSHDSETVFVLSGDVVGFRLGDHQADDQQAQSNRRQELLLKSKQMPRLSLCCPQSSKQVQRTPAQNDQAEVLALHAHTSQVHIRSSLGKLGAILHG